MLQPNQYTPPTHSPVSYGRQFIRLRHVEAKCGFKRSHIYNLIKLGDFPTPIKIGGKRSTNPALALSRFLISRR